MDATRHITPPDPAAGPRTRIAPVWLVPTGLILLSLIPVLAGAARLTDLMAGSPVDAANARFVASPAPVVLHVVGATSYSLLGAFQFVPALRRRGRRWHRLAGRILFPTGLVAALSGLWMAMFYELPAHDGQLLLLFRLLFGAGMALSLILGVRAIVAGDRAAHGAWMTRAYALGLGAGTQALILIVPELLGDPPGATPRALLMGAGWAGNLAVAEMLIRRRRVRALGG